MEQTPTMDPPANPKDPDKKIVIPRMHGQTSVLLLQGFRCTRCTHVWTDFTASVQTSETLGGVI